MAATSPVNSVGYTTSIFRNLSSSKITSLFKRIDWAFALFLTAGVSYCLYHLYRVYQLRLPTSFGLDDRLKLVKCRAWLDEAQEKDSQPLLDRCETLLASIPGIEKNPLLRQLAQHYATHDPYYAYQIAQQLSSSDDLFEAAQAIQKQHPDFDSAKLNSLFTRAFQAPIRKHRGLQQSLEFGKAFHLLKNDELKNRSSDEACKSIPGGNDLGDFRDLCDIAKYYHDVEDQEQRDFYLGRAQNLDVLLTRGDSVSAYLALAHTFFDIGAYEKMNLKLLHIRKLFNEPLFSLSWINNLLSSVELAKKIAESDQVPPEFKVFEVEPLINLAFNARTRIENEDALRYAHHFSSLATAYQAVGNHDKAKEAADLASTTIQGLPETKEDEIRSKIHSLLTLIYLYKAVPEKARPLTKLIEALYDRLPGGKELKGNTILNCYNDLNLTEESAAFLERYLLIFNKKDAFTNISELVATSKQNNQPAQKKAFLEAAEKLLPQVDSSEHALAISFIADGYLQVDRQKSLQFLENYQHLLTTRHLTTAAVIAAVTALALGILYLYPTQSLMISSLAMGLITSL